MQRRKIVAGNWKMNMDLSTSAQLIKGLKEGKKDDDVLVIVAPPSIYASKISEWLGDSNIQVAAQNVHPAEKGAFTGELSVSMLKDVGIQAALVGHSERRELFNESNQFLTEKLNAVLDKNLTCIFCCGEPLEVRKAGEQNAYVARQIQEGLFHLEDIHYVQIIIAYEPIWAIGTGETASPAQAEEMHAFIRSELAKQYDQKLADSVSILYGGSVKPNNAKEIFSGDNVDGALVGGASLDADSFLAIINSY